jgi:hypothetical protein
MRNMAIAAAALALAASQAGASTPLPGAAEVRVKISPELQAKAHEDYGVEDVEDLARDLQRSVSRELHRTGALAGAHIELTLVDARPSRPTFRQMSKTPGLSYRSFGLGGAEIRGEAVTVDGAVIPISYRWYEHDIRDARFSTTWGHADRAIDRLAHRLARGQVLASR